MYLTHCGNVQTIHGRVHGSLRDATAKEGAFKSAYDVMNNWGANHGAISYGHIGADLITFASMLRIPVAMHNVPEDKIFRSGSHGMHSVWTKRALTTEHAQTTVHFTNHINKDKSKYLCVV